MCFSVTLKTDWEKCVEFHGHECMGLANGYQIALLAMKKLGVTRAEDEELFAIVENDACGVDAIQFLTGCTLGKGNLIYKDSGKQALTLASRKKGKAVRLLRKIEEQKEDARTQNLRQKVRGGTANQEEMEEWQKLQKERITVFLATPGEDLFSCKEVPVPKIERARIFRTVVCEECGEPFAEIKARLAEGKILCTDCMTDYTRGW